MNVYEVFTHSRSYLENLCERVFRKSIYMARNGENGSSDDIILYANHDNDARDIISSILANPTNTDLGDLALEYMVINNAQCYNAIQTNMDEFIQNNGNIHLTEIGPGIGYFCDTLIKKYNDKISNINLIDNSEYINEMLSYKYNNNNNINVLNLDINTDNCLTNKINDDSQDFIIHLNNFYFWVNMENTLNELKRILKPNGNIICGYRSLAKYMSKKYFYNNDYQSYISTLNKTGFDMNTLSVKDYMDGFTLISIKK